MLKELALCLGLTDPVVFDALSPHGPEAFVVARVESSFNPRAVSSAGAVGLMQVLPSTARWIAPICGLNANANLFDPTVNAAFGACYLRMHLGTFQGNHTLAYVAYNAGASRAVRFSDTQRLNQETAHYVSKVWYFKNKCGVK